MPLPDERPRKTVANLIGQFEKQKSVSSTAVPFIPRTSSVTSHRTGDSAVEEIKEKREWPPKSVPPPVFTVPTSDVSSTPDLQTTSPADTPSVSSPLENKIVSVVSVQVTPPTPATATPPVAAPQTPVADQTVSITSQPKPTMIATAVKASPTKSKVKSDHAPTASRTSIIKTNPSQPTPPSTKTSGRASVSSTPVKTPVKPAGTPRTPASNPSISTPNRAKSPSEVSTRTPVTRPKTPSHLYTPTAASLARSRNSAPAPPPVEKPRRKLTSDLTKPTAASVSKMRSVVTPPTLSRSPKPAVTKPTIKSSIPSSKSASAIKSTAKPPSRPNTANTTPNSSTVHDSVPVQTPGELVAVHRSQEVETEIAQNITGDDEVREQCSKGTEEVENYDDDFAADEPQEPVSVVNEPEQEPVDQNSHEPVDVDHVPETAAGTLNFDKSPSDLAHEPQTVEQVENTVEPVIKSSPGAGTELEDLVNMLEKAPTLNHPNLEAVAADIPDEQ